MIKKICTLTLLLLGVIGFIETGSALVHAKRHKASVQKSHPVHSGHPKKVVARPTKSSDRVALVIGNAAYIHAPLDNPVNDATDVARKLRSLGFDVVERKNVKMRQIGSILKEFSSKLKPGAVALVFYAGHGLQIKGENYFPAVDAEISSEIDVPNQSISVKQIMDVLDDSKSGLNLVFLDACRDNPYARSFRSASRGLARVVAPSGTLISYATRPGSVAADGEGHNGLYTSKLLKQFESNQPIELALKNVVSEVKAASKGKQEPWMEGSIEGEFCFKTCASAMAQADSEDDSDNIELSFWDSIKDSKNPADFQAYLGNYPNGKFAALARNRLNLSTPQSESIVEDKPEAQTTPAISPVILSPAPVVINKPALKTTPAVVAPVSTTVSKPVPQTSAITDSAAVAPLLPATEVWKSVDPEMVKLPNGLLMSKYEITQGQWQIVMGNNPSMFSNCGDDCPVEQVSWNDVQAYIAQLNKKTGKKYRLPTEAEWVSACQAGKSTEYCGSDDIDAVAWYKGNSGNKTHIVGKKRPNAWGLHDMSGNVLEWTGSCYEAQDCSGRVLRGGSWGGNSKNARSALRGRFDADVRSSYLGFRLVLGA